MLFCGLEFEISPDTLPPYAATAELANIAIGYLKALENPVFCDVGTGDGNLAVTISVVMGTIGYGVDIRGLDAARRNAEKHQASCSFLHSNGLENAPKELDLIIANLPYMPLEQAQRMYNAKHLLSVTDGDDGLSLIDKLIQDAPSHLKADGTLLIEYTWKFGDRVLGMFDKQIWKEVRTLCMNTGALLGFSAHI